MRKERATFIKNVGVHDLADIDQHVCSRLVVMLFELDLHLLGVVLKAIRLPSIVVMGRLLSCDLLYPLVVELDPLLFILDKDIVMA